MPFSTQNANGLVDQTDKVLVNEQPYGRSYLNVSHMESYDKHNRQSAKVGVDGKLVYDPGGKFSNSHIHPNGNDLPLLVKDEDAQVFDPGIL